MIIQVNLVNQKKIGKDMDTPSWKKDIIDDPNHYMILIKYLLILLHALIYFSGHQVPFLVVQLCSENEKRRK